MEIFDVLEAENRRLREALGPDLAGRPFSELLNKIAAWAFEQGGGPMRDCVLQKAEDVRAALAETEEKEEAHD